MMRLAGLVMIEGSAITIFGTVMPRKWYKRILVSEAPNQVHGNKVILACYLRGCLARP